MTLVGTWLSAAKDLDKLERELLIAHILGITRTQLLIREDQELTETQIRSLETSAALLRRGMPFAYVIGSQEFWSMEFKVTPDVLIPRPETELLVELACAQAPTDADVLDLGTGSGAIAISIADERPDLNLTATDKSKAALAIAEFNNIRHNTKVRFLHSDWFSDLKGTTYDIIVCNPPYIADRDPHLSELAWEPTAALVSGDGLDDIRKIVAQARKHLLPQGKVFIEHGYDQAKQVQFLLQTAGFQSVQSHADLAGILRVTSAQRIDS
ncbi:MAG: peptide chain release factor N(5)-glutamine methyltransferase [Pseudomonadota bacterium]